jgi:hypothetical protein
MIMARPSRVTSREVIAGVKQTDGLSIRDDTDLRTQSSEAGYRAGRRRKGAAAEYSNGTANINFRCGEQRRSPDRRIHRSEGVGELAPEKPRRREGVWIKFAKKAAPVKTQTHAEALEAALCY